MLEIWRPAYFSFLILKEHHPKGGHKTIFSGFKFYKMTLFNQIDFRAFFRLRKKTFRNFIDSGIQQSASPLPRKMVLRRHVLGGDS
jgi:hypothetical protein